MFFNEAVLSKRGPLAKVWLASHMGERKLSKAQLLATSIPKSVGAIMGEELVPMALRLSGQLLLGVARIYSRKAKYLMDDCSDALLKIKMTFRPGAVDMTEEQSHVPRGAITRQDNMNEFDLLYAEAGLDLWGQQNDAEPRTGPSKPSKVATAADADITLPQNDFETDLAGTYDYDLGGIGLDSQVFDAEGGGLDFDLGFGEDGIGDDIFGDVDGKGKSNSNANKRPREEDEDLSVEIGRDGPGSSARKSARLSAGDGLNGDVTFDDDFMADGMGLGMDLDFGDALPGIDGGAGTDIDLLAEGERTPRQSSLAPQDDSVDVTPRTAVRVAEAAALRSAAKKKAIGQSKLKKQIIDSVTELDKGSQAGASQGRTGKDTKEDRLKLGLIIEPTFLPRSRLHLRYLEINATPAAYYFPAASTDDQLSVAPPGLPPQLASLFKLPADRKRTAAQAGAARKRPRADEDESVEMGRRASEAPTLRDDYGGGNGTGDWDNIFDDFGGGGDDSAFQFDVDGVQAGADAQASSALRKQFSDRLSTPMPDFETPPRPGAGPLAIFDDALSMPPSVSRFEETPSKASVEETPSKSSPGKGWSKNTIKAMQVLGDELQVDDDADEPKTLSFDGVATKASRQAAASFFFELLVLGSRNCLEVEQETPYGDIKVQAKPKLWEVTEKAVGGESLRSLYQSTPTARR